MRCKRCGWMNAADAEICVKCQNPIRGTMVESQASGDSGHENEEAKKTMVIRGEGQQEAPERVKHHCPNCGYPVWNDMTICPQCKYTLQTKTDTDDAGKASVKQEGNAEADMKKTINPYARSKKPAPEKPGPHLTLSAQHFSSSKQKGQPQTRVFPGEEIFLNRLGESATSAAEAQVALRLEDGQWYLEDVGEVKNTFLLASRKIPVQVGDIILINDRQCQITELVNNNSDNNKK